jgi:hypothetical protein
MAAGLSTTSHLQGSSGALSSGAVEVMKLGEVMCRRGCCTVLLHMAVAGQIQASLV